MYLLHHLLRDAAAKYPQRTAVAFKNRNLTYSDLEARSNQLCASLVRHGVNKGDRIAIMLNKSFESIISVFGILKAGAIYVPLDPVAPAARACSLINHCGIEIIIASQENLAKVLSEAEAGLTLRKAIVTVTPPDAAPSSNAKIEYHGWEEPGAGMSENHCTVEQSDAAPAYILHTSGSTGMPKGVVISHLNALTFVNMAASFFGINEDDRMANHAPLHFDLSILDIFCAVKSGAAIVIVPEFLSAFPVRLAEFIDQEKITVWNSVASVLTKLADQGALERLSFPSLRLVHFSGDLMPAKYLRSLKKCMAQAEFYNIYGQTEANSSLYFKVPGTIIDDAWKIPIGKPFPNFDVFGLDDEGKVISKPNEEGELHVLSATVALGYWNDLKKTQEQFTSDPRNPAAHARVYKTGDLVRIDDEGNYVFAGRKDHMVKSKGFRVELDEIEIVLSSHPRVRQAAVVAIPDDLAGNRIIAYICLNRGSEIASKELLDLCADRLPKYMVPEMIRFRQALPTSSNEKINRKALVQEFISELNGAERKTL